MQWAWALHEIALIMIENYLKGFGFQTKHGLSEMCVESLTHLLSLLPLTDGRGKRAAECSNNSIRWARNPRI